MSDFDSVIAPRVRELVRRQNDAIDAACWEALRIGATVHVYTEPEPMETWDHGVSMFTTTTVVLVPGPIGIVYHTPGERADD